MPRPTMPAWDTLIPATAPTPPPAAQPSVVAPTPPPGPASGGKYTIVIPGDVQAALLTDLAELTRTLGHQPKRSHVYLALLALLHDDPGVRRQVVARLPRYEDEATARRRNGSAA